MNLGGRTALVTGASGGLGQAIARALARRGAELVLTARRVEVLEPLAAELRGRAVPCDLADRAALERLAAEAGPVDVLVANAGITISGGFDAWDVADLDQALDVNLRAPMILARLFGERMAAEGGGHIVLVSSTNGKVAPPGTAVYAATKFGLRGFGQALRQDLRRSGVGVSTVLPGFVRDAGMFHDVGVEFPFYVRTTTAEDVARGVVTAIERNRGEVVVAPRDIRIGAALAGLAPELAGRVQRLLGAERMSADFTAARRRKPR